VEAVLRWVRSERPDVICWLLTGNTPAGGAAKLRYYGLEAFFPSGAFSERVEPREEIARRAWASAVDVFPDLVPGEIVVIGDTPHDIRCARAIGARALAVASHTHPPGELAAHAPWVLLDRLPPVEQFSALLFPPASP
jgi:phosphoglycolate phosphatase-like HAD superfamily hydrolase